MNIDRIQRLFNRSAFVISLLTGALALTACGGSSNNDRPASSSSSSVSSSSSSSSSSSNDAVWPDINVFAESPKTLSFSWTPVTDALFYRLYKNADGASGFTLVGADINGTATTESVSVHLHDWINATYYVEACLTADCGDKVDSTPVTTPSAMLGAIAYFKASNTGANDWFGWSVDVSGDGQTLVVGAPAEDSNATGIDGDQTSNTSPSSGAVYVFAMTNGQWAQQAYIKASNTEQPNEDADLTLPNDRFGYRVALSDDGNTLAVSALFEDSSAAGINCDQGNFKFLDTAANKVKHQNVNTGAVYIFTRNGTTWVQEAYLKAAPTYLNHQFGYSLAFSGDGDTLAVGTVNDEARFAGIPSSSSSSHDPRRCENANAVPSSASSSSSSSVSSSSSSSTTSTSSSSSSAPAGGPSSGAVYIFHRADGVWIQEALIKASNANAGDSFGASVALSGDGNRLAVGAPGEDSDATGVNGNESRNYALATPSGLQELNAGAVYLFNRTDSVWAQDTYLKPDYVSWSLQFGNNVSLSSDGSTLAVSGIGDISRATGVNGDPSDFDLVQLDLLYPAGGAFRSGAAYVFTHNGTTWTQNAYIKASNAQAEDQFGHKLKLSADGQYLAVSTIIEAGSSRGINGDQTDDSAANTGAVYVFGLDAGNWVQISYVKPSNTRGGDRFGADLGLSGDGSVMAVGGYRDASNATGVNGDQHNNAAPSSGAVYVY